MNNGPDECQPCNCFVGRGDPGHDCFAPLPDGTRCGGIVRYCYFCLRDHHEGGYNTCRGSWHGLPCPRNHPKCRENAMKHAIPRTCTQCGIVQTFDRNPRSEFRFLKFRKRTGTPRYHPWCTPCEQAAFNKRLERKAEELMSQKGIQ